VVVLIYTAKHRLQSDKSGITLTQILKYTFGIEYTVLNSNLYWID